MTLPPLGLYIHLPWCERKCPYCDFNSHEARELPEDDYICALAKDIHADAALAQGREIQTLFIGGGTPSLFSAAAIAKLLEAISTTVAIASDAEITMEANPGSAEAEKFRGFRRAGVNRLSLGIQSFNDARLRSLGRVHSSKQALKAIEYAHGAFSNFNLDLMHGLPGQTFEEAHADLATAIECDANHLSWYQLTIEPNTQFFSKPPLLPVEDDLAEIQQCGEALLAAASYQQYEVSAYSRHGQQCAHNLNYWTFGDYIGIGAGAHGKITHADGRIERYAKVRQPRDYLAREAGNFIAQKNSIALADLPGEFAMNALRLRDGISIEMFSQRSFQSAEILHSIAGPLVERGLLSLAGNRMKATPLGFLHLDSIVGEFFPDQP